MRVVRVLFEEEIKMFGLSEEEVREIAGKVVRSYSKRNGQNWELNDVRTSECQIAIECNGRFGCLPKFLEDVAKEIFKEIVQALEDYAYLKQFFIVYNNCNGHNGRSEAKEIMRKLGIPVIS